MSDWAKVLVMLLSVLLGFAYMIAGAVLELFDKLPTARLALFAVGFVLVGFGPCIVSKA